MKLNKKILSVIVTGAILSSTYVTFASVVTATPKTTTNPEVTTSATTTEDRKIEFSHFTGKITEIKDFTDADGKKVEGSKVIYLTDEPTGKQFHFNLNEKTYYVDKEFKVGDMATAHYDPNLPTTKIYPPIYTAVVFSINKETESIKVDRFDENLLSYDKDLKLNVSDKTVIVTEDNKEFKGDIKNRKLIVIYSFTTRSIPAQTSPTKIIVLFETAVAPILTINEPQVTTEITGAVTPEVTSKTETKSEIPSKDKALGLTVNNESLKNLAPFVNDKGVVMVPFRDACEALEQKISWDDKEKSIVLGENISFAVGKDAYYLNKEKLVLGTAPVIVNEKTFVPLKFFTEVLKLNNAYVLENTVFIDNGIKMD